MTTTNTFPAAILFDHDGTLVDTEPVWAAAKVALAADFGGTWTEQDTLDCLGLSMQFTLDRLRERGVNLPDQEINDRLVAKVREALAHQPVEFLPGIERFLSEVREAQIPAAVVTNATTSVAQRTANAAPEGTFSVIIGNDETTHPKPDPQPYLLAAERLGVDPTQCVAIEDSPSGVRSATVAGMRVIVVPGELEVPAELGTARFKHEELTLEAVRALVNQ
ncbi:HAD family phosphatase [Rothia sp. HMSC068F09]|uniref:HAD family hydrolase n=1 Tax=Rothia sp. HMSC068F09 TaxID=1739378 RepID=UPI0008A4D2DE|nr:HAD family phosphatase [Rothia sp. HMSC068F09]OFR67764.1 phosphoglycolate phosphatase [Rothia sp. HMSC068F09]